MGHVTAPLHLLEGGRAVNESNADIRHHLRRAWAQRDGHAIWFYGSWLFNRYYGTVILVNAAVIVFVAAAALAWKADVL